MSNKSGTDLYPPGYATAPRSKHKKWLGDQASAEYTHHHLNEPVDLVNYIQTFKNAVPPHQGSHFMPYMAGAAGYANSGNNVYATSRPQGKNSEKWTEIGTDVMRERMRRVHPVYHANLPSGTNPIGSCCEWVTLLKHFDDPQKGTIRTVNTLSWRMKDLRPTALCPTCKSAVRNMAARNPGLIIVDAVTQFRYLSRLTGELEAHVQNRQRTLEQVQGILLMEEAAIVQIDRQMIATYGSERGRQLAAEEIWRRAGFPYE